MKLCHKLISGFFLISLLIPAVGFYTINISRKALQDSIGHDAELLARETMDKIDRSIYRRIEDVQAYAKDLILQQYVQQSNREFRSLSDIQSYIDKKDREWSSLPPEKITPFKHELMSNKLAEELRERIEFHEKKSGQKIFPGIYVTNRYGANVAQTGKTFDYRQDDEEWWQETREKGLFVKDVGYNQILGLYTVDFSVRINDEDGNFMGVIKAMLNIEESIRIVNNLKQDEMQNGHLSGNFKLITGDGRLIYSTGDFTILEDVSDLLAIAKRVY